MLRFPILWISFFFTSSLDTPVGSGPQKYPSFFQVDCQVSFRQSLTLDFLVSVQNILSFETLYAMKSMFEASFWLAMLSVSS